MLSRCIKLGNLVRIRSFSAFLFSKEDGDFVEYIENLEKLTKTDKTNTIRDNTF